MMLVKWGTDRADEEGKDAYVISSPAGKPLYLKAGFEEVGTLKLFGVTFYQMLWKAKPRCKAE